MGAHRGNSSLIEKDKVVYLISFEAHINSVASACIAQVSSKLLVTLAETVIGLQQLAYQHHEAACS